ncbi:GIY-YIG nuclease family protein [Candidatus Parcubacteria bacterium]|nr:GIY-YIG nuclease family protein [Patescibacteria group bacterium]MCG2688671.1 GIY-YIG nuclease family protein [Candidatus Parcubacteria bacterium]
MYNWYYFSRDVDKAPSSEGVYLLSETNSEDGIIYVGRADNLRERLFEHPDPQNPCLKRKDINYFAYEATTDSERREGELIGKYDPECNRTN